MSVLAAKRKEFEAKTAEAVALRDTIAEAVKANTPTDDEQKSFDTIMDVTIPALEAEIKRLEKLEAAELKANADKDDDETPAPPKAAGLAEVKERFVNAPTLGEQLVNCDSYKAALKNIGNSGRVGQGQATFSFESKAFGDINTKATFTTSGTGLDTTVNYLSRPVELLQQQRLTVRDLLPVGQTTQSSVKWIKEDVYTNSATTLAEEGEKPEASFDTGTSSADVKKIAVVAKVTDEMWADFPMLRDYVNTRLRFMVEATEETQLINGSGSGNNITGILNVSGLQTQAKGSDSNSDAIFKAMTKIRVATGTVGGYQPSGIVLHPTDWQIIRLTKDDNNQYYGGGPFTGAYGVGNLTGIATDSLWGLPVVVTNAISSGTGLVGDFRTGAQIWQREGIRVDSTNTNEDDFNFNRISLRVEERLALAIYRPSAFCTVTSIA